MSWGWLGCRGWLRRQGRLGRLGQRLSVLSVLATRFLGGLSQAIGYFIAALREGVYIKLQKPFVFGPDQDRGHRVFAVLCTGAPR